MPTGLRWMRSLMNPYPVANTIKEESESAGENAAGTRREQGLFE